MYCKYCGQPIGETDVFCMHCGMQLTNAESDPQKNIASETPNKKPLNTLGLAGFIVSTISLIFLTVFGVTGFLGLIAGLVLSAVGLARRDQYSQNGFAIAGIVIGAVGLFFCLLILLFCSWLFWGLIWFS